MSLIPANNHSISVIVNIKHLAIPSHKSLIDLPFSMQFIEALLPQEVPFLEAILCCTFLSASGIIASSLLRRTIFVDFVFENAGCSSFKIVSHSSGVVLHVKIIVLSIEYSFFFPFNHF